MIWALLAVLGVPLWMLAGALIAAMWSRRSYKRTPGVFAAKVRTVSGAVNGLKGTWPRRPVLLRWVHDVLEVHRGLAMVRTHALGVDNVTGPVAPLDGKLRGLGARPLVLTLVLDGGASVQLVTAAENRNSMVGPFAGLLLDAGRKVAGSG